MGIGYYSNKHPQSTDAYYKDIAEAEAKKQNEYNEYIIGRKETHENQMLDKLLVSINIFSNSINNLATAIANQKAPIVMNINGLENPTAVANLMNYIKSNR